MDDNTLSNWGWVIIATLIAVAMIAFASPYSDLITGEMLATVNKVDVLGETQEGSLAQPTNLSLKENILSFTPVTNADKYLVTIKSETIDVTSEITGTNVDLSSALSASNEIVTITVTAIDSSGDLLDSQPISLIEDLG